MKKITLLACACALFLAPVVNAQEVQYVEDPAQGYIFNRMQDNWFIQAEGGVGVMMSYKDAQMKLGKRFMAPKANLFIGKWFSPLLGVRIGGHFEQMKGATDINNINAIGYRTDMGDQMKDDARGVAGQKFNRIGVTGDVLFNVTNWLCGYKPGRFYNAVVYAGASTSWNFYNDKADGSGSWKYKGAENGKEGTHSRNFALQAGLLNTFALGKHVDLLLDLRFDMIQEHIDNWGHKTWNEYPSAMLGLAYKFGKTEWNAPVVPICPQYQDLTPELDALRNKLAQANAKIRDLENQLNDCLNWKRNHKCPETVVNNNIIGDAPLATVYFPRGKSYITPLQMEVVNAVSDVMNNESDTYKLTGWADNYTGNDAINIKLRHDRVNGVKKALEDKGVDGGRLDTETNNENHPHATSLASAPLGRCVTIERNK